MDFEGMAAFFKWAPIAIIGLLIACIVLLGTALHFAAQSSLTCPG